MAEKRQQKIRVLHIITRLVKGGAQINTFLTVTNLDSSRYYVTLVSGQSITSKCSTAEGEIECEARKLGVDLIIVPELVREINPVLDLRAFLKLYRLIKSASSKDTYDIVHTHTSKAGFLGRVAAKLASDAIIVHTPHGSPYVPDANIPAVSSLNRTLFFWLDKVAAAISDKIVALTNSELEQYIEIGLFRNKSDAVVIHSGVDLKKFTELPVARAMASDSSRLRMRLGIPDGSPVIITVARLTSEKGHTYLNHAVKRVVGALAEIAPDSYNQGVRFLFVGDGILRNRLEEQVRQLGLDEAIMFLGLRHDVPELLAISDVFVLPSLYEAQGRVLVEAMAAGLPVVATNVGGIPDVVVHGETGLLVPPRDPGALATAIIDLILDKKKAKRMGESGRKRVEPEFSVQTMVEKIDKLYCSLIQAKRASTLEEN